jgi:hypothetical protein
VWGAHLQAGQAGGQAGRGVAALLCGAGWPRLGGCAAVRGQSRLLQAVQQYSCTLSSGPGCPSPASYGTATISLSSCSSNDQPQPYASTFTGQCSEEAAAAGSHCPGPVCCQLHSNARCNASAWLDTAHVSPAPRLSPAATMSRNPSATLQPVLRAILALQAAQFPFAMCQCNAYEPYSGHRRRLNLLIVRRVCI